MFNESENLVIVFRKSWKGDLKSLESQVMGKGRDLKLTIGVKRVKGKCVVIYFHPLYDICNFFHNLSFILA
jgi:hypothetical protein